MAASAFLVQIPANFPARHLIGGVDSMVVFAFDSADAIAVAKSQYPGGDSDALWAVATATALTAAGTLTEFDMRAIVNGMTPAIDLTVSAAALGFNSITAVAAGGTGYSANDILTLVGGTSSRVGKVKVLTVSTGAVATAEVVDPGDYTVAPANPVAVTGGGGTGATFTMPALAATAYQNLISALVTALNATAIDAAAMTLATSGPLLTVAGTADNIGDKTITVQYRRRGIAIPSLLSTVTHGGSAGAALSVVLPAAADRTLPKVVTVFRA